MKIHRVALSLLLVFTQVFADDAPPDCGKNFPECVKACGIPPRRDDCPAPGLIVGGEDVPIGLYPWFARAEWVGCGGMLVTPEFILSAAHCMGFGELSGSWGIGAHTSPWMPGNNGGQFMETRDNVASWIHPLFDGSTLDFDFALLKLDSPVTTIDPVPIDQDQYSPEYPDDKNNLWAIGLGTLSSGGPTPDILQHVEVGYVSQSECNGDYSGVITPRMMCAADPGQDACQGDSGGPLYDLDNDAVVGITSWGIGCANPLYPGVYSRVARGWTWIQQTICDNSDEKPEFCDDTPPGPCKPFKLEILTDDYGDETGWQLGKRIEAPFPWELVDGAGFGAYGDNTLYTKDLCLPEGECYKMRVLDSWGDGMCCEYGEGGFRVTYDGEVIEANNFRNGDVETTPTFGDCD